MKQTVIFTLILLTVFVTNHAKPQTTPPSDINMNSISEPNKFLFISDTINFTPYPTGTIMTNQYQDEGVIFSGFNGSTDPLIYDFSPDPMGRVLRSDNWYNALRVNFIDTLNASHYMLAKKIEFDNPCNSEVDYIRVDIYDSLNNHIMHYLSESPEHVVLNFTIPTAAYMVLDDSAETSYVVDNILVDFGNTSNINKISNDNIMLFPNPNTGSMHIFITEKSKLEIVNTEGKTIYTCYTLDKETIVNTDKIPDGIYLLKVTSNKGIVIKKFIKQ
jgi:hypothetical protein